MPTTEDFRQGVIKLRQKTDYVADDAEYMADMAHWVCVHATKYMPKRDKTGKSFIPTTAMATGNKIPRATVHVTLNQIVHSHMFGNWDDKPFVVIAPYKDVVANNEDPVLVDTLDTYFAPNPDTGLVLPASTYIVKPNNNTLFSVGDKFATYKTDNFTDEEVKTILSFVDADNREKYEKYSRGELTETEVLRVLPPEYASVYKNAKDKRAFVRGLFEEDKMVILTHFLRDAVVYMSMEKMGYRHVCSYKGNPSAEKVEQVAKLSGLEASNGGETHFDSLWKEMEDASFCWYALIEALKKQDFEKIYQELIKFDDNTLNHMLNGDIPDVYALYAERFYQRVNSHVKSTELDIKMLQDSNAQYNAPLDNMPFYQKKLEKYKRLQQKGIVAYNQNLDIALRRNATRTQDELKIYFDKLRNRPEWEDMKNKIYSSKMSLEMFLNGRTN